MSYCHCGHCYQSFDSSASGLSARTGPADGENADCSRFVGLAAYCASGCHRESFVRRDGHCSESFTCLNTAKPAHHALSARWRALCVLETLFSGPFRLGCAMEAVPRQAVLSIRRGGHVPRSHLCLEFGCLLESDLASIRNLAGRQCKFGFLLSHCCPDWTRT